jgi:tetratricopeptide (TPR) repeat protein
VKATLEGEGLGKWSRAEEQLDAAVGIDPNNGEALTALAWIYSRRRDWTRALATLERAVTLDPASVTKTMDLALLSSIAHRFDSSVALYERVIELAPEFAPPYLNLAFVYQDGFGDTANARQALLRGERRFGRVRLVNQGCLSCVVGQLSVGLGYADALDSLRLDGPEPPDSADFYTALAFISRRRGNYERAKAMAESVLAVAQGRVRARPNDPGLQLNLASGNLETGRRGAGFDALREYFRLAREQGGDQLPWSEAGLWGFAHAIVGEYEAAVDSFAVALKTPAEQVITRHLLRFQGRLEPLRRIPRFRALIDSAP